MDKALPRFVPPMLAVQGQPFDSEEHFFEFKWDGFRAGAMIEAGSVRLMSRNSKDLLSDYAELSVLNALPSGLALDGEIVAFRDGVPDFDLMLKRRGKGGNTPVRYVAFDVLYRDFEPLVHLPFTDRRLVLEEVMSRAAIPQLVLSEGVRGGGRKLYQSACEQGLEGVVAKRLSSAYAVGKRNGSWIKIKRRLRIHAAIIGFIEKEGSDFQSLLVASAGLPGETQGKLRYVGRVGGGFTAEARARINQLLRDHPSDTPLVACPERGRWIEPGLYCEVSFAELTEGGLLRAPVFEGVIDS